MYVCIYVCVCIYVYIYIYVSVCVCVIYIYIHTHTHTHTCTHKKKSLWSIWWIRCALRYFPWRTSLNLCPPLMRFFPFFFFFLSHSSKYIPSTFPTSLFSSSYPLLDFPEYQWHFFCVPKTKKIISSMAKFVWNITWQNSDY